MDSLACECVILEWFSSIFLFADSLSTELDLIAPELKQHPRSVCVLANSTARLAFVTMSLHDGTDWHSGYLNSLITHSEPPCLAN